MIEAGLVSFIDDAVGIMPYPAKLEQTPAMPGITYQRINTNRLYTQEGDSKKPKAFFDLNIWGEDELQAKELANQLRPALSGYRGMMGSHRVDSVFIRNEQDGREDSTDRYRIIMSISIDHSEEEV